MRDTLIVAKFTIKEMIRRKSFIISTLIILALIVIGFNIPNIMKSINGEETKQKLIIVDQEKLFEGNLNIVKELITDYEIEISNKSLNAVKKDIESEKTDGAIVVNKEKEKIIMTFLIKDTTMMEKVPEDIVSAMNILYTNIQIEKLDITPEEKASIRPNFEFKLEQTSDKKAEGNILAMMLMSIVLFYAIYFCAYQVSSSITTEKTSKIMETLVTSTSPTNIVIGKTIGIGITGLIQLVLLLVTAYISAKLFIDKELLDSIVDMSYINLYLGVMTIIYFILGYGMYALLYALTGSTVSKPEDIQSANTPVAIITMFGFYLAYFTMLNPTSNLNLLACLLPISSPFCMPFRIMMGLSDGKDVILSLILLIISIIVIAKIAIKIYSNAILNYGTKISIKNLFKMYREK